MEKIIRYLKSLGYNPVSSDYYKFIEFWKKWYEGRVPAFHNYRQYNGKKKISRIRKSLTMAKKITEDWADLLLNEKLDIFIDDKAVNEAVHDILNDNNFAVKGNRLVELTFALGTGAFVEYLDENGDIKINYIRAGMIFPLTWENDTITECAFATKKKVGDAEIIYLNIHKKDEWGDYIIENKMFKAGSAKGFAQVDLPEKLEEEVHTHSDVPMFQIIKPNICNNLDLDSPLGISVYANAIDQLEGLDLVYDSYCNEFRLGKKRIIVPINMAKMEMEKDGTTTPLFDDNDTEFYAVDFMTKDGVSPTLQEINMQIRAEEHDRGINKALSLLSYKCGMGTNKYSFEKGTVKTATEVKSDNADLYDSLKKHELVLKAGIEAMVKAIIELLGIQKEVEITLTFDDNIIEDTTAEKQMFLQELREGVRQKYEYRMHFFGEDEKTAKAMSQSDDLMFEGEE